MWPLWEKNTIVRWILLISLLKKKKNNRKIFFLREVGDKTVFSSLIAWNGLLTCGLTIYQHIIMFQFRRSQITQQYFALFPWEGEKAAYCTKEIGKKKPRKLFWQVSKSIEYWRVQDGFERRITKHTLARYVICLGLFLFFDRNKCLYYENGDPRKGCERHSTTNPAPEFVHGNCENCVARYWILWLYTEVWTRNQLVLFPFQIITIQCYSVARISERFP